MSLVAKAGQHTFRVFRESILGAGEGLARPLRIFANNLKDRDLLVQRMGIGGLTALTHYITQDSSYTSVDSELFTKRAALVGSLPFLGSMFLPKATLLQDLYLAGLYMTSDIVGPVLKHRIQKEESLRGTPEGESYARSSRNIAYATGAGIWLYSAYSFIENPRAFRTAIQRSGFFSKQAGRFLVTPAGRYFFSSPLFRSLLFAGTVLGASYYTARWSEQHAGNFSGVDSRFTANMVGSAASEISPWELRKRLEVAPGLRGVVAGGMTLAVWNLAVLGPAITNFYTQVGDGNWVEGQRSSAMRQVTMTPVRIWQAARPAYAQFLPMMGGDMVFGTMNWKWVDQVHRSLGGRGQWRGEVEWHLDSLVHLNHNEPARAEGYGCRELHEYMRRSMSSWSVLHWQRELDPVDFVHQDPNIFPMTEGYVSLEDHLVTLRPEQKRKFLACDRLLDSKEEPDLYQMTRPAVARLSNGHL